MKPSTRTLAAALAAATALLTATPRPAGATGMQGHIYMAMCAAEQVTDPRLRAIFDGYPMHLANGGFLPDSGYVSDDHDQGEIPHWEAFVDAYVQLVRETYPSPDDSPEAAQHAAVLMGMAAHGITDSTFDTLLYARAEQVEPEPTDSFDTAMDIFIVADMPRYFIPDFAYDASTISEVFTRVDHPRPPEKIEGAMSTARSGIAVVSNLLYKGADEYGAKYPWGRAHFLDGRTPGSYAFGAKVVMGYYRELLRRLDGDETADQIVIGTYPDAAYPMVTVDATRPDGKLIFFFGEGLDRTTIDDGTISVIGPDGLPVPVTVSVFRGDEWANVLIAEAQQDWQSGATYEVTLHATVKTLHGQSPGADHVFSFTTCASPDASGDCPAPDGPPPASACPKTEEQYSMRPGEGTGGSGGGTGGTGGSGSGDTGGASGGADGEGNQLTGGSACGCGIDGDSGRLPGSLLALALGIALARRRRRRRRRRLPMRGS